jgi:hypothetical protein
MQNKIAFATSVLALFAVATCGNNQDKEQKLKETAKQLIEYLYKGDTSNIRKLFIDSYIAQQKKEGLVYDCREFRKIIDKYGFPSMKEVHLIKGELSENILPIILADRVDSILGFRKSVILVVFPPDQFSQKGKIYSYAIKITPLDTAKKPPPIIRIDTTKKNQLPPK